MSIYLEIKRSQVHGVKTKTFLHKCRLLEAKLIFNILSMSRYMLTEFRIIYSYNYSVGKNIGKYYVTFNNLKYSYIEIL